MKRLSILIVLPLLLSFFLWGCSADQYQVSPDVRATMAPIIIPSGATVVSATLNVYAGTSEPHVVNVHRITADWDEVTVTYNSFAGAYDPFVFGSFAAAPGWNAADITDLFNGWLSGAYVNYGILLDQEVMAYPMVTYFAREAPVNHAYLDVCYDEGGIITCVQTEVVMDTDIREHFPNQNYGTNPVFYTGWLNENELEKQALLRFELEEEPQEGCSHTIGYWKTHAGFGPQDNEVSQYLPISLGNDGGAVSLLVSDSAIAVDVLRMKTYGHNRNGITKLYAQLLGAKLSIADGASDIDIADAIIEADEFLATHDWTDWNSLSKYEQGEVLILMSTFDDFNNGYIGPGHCDEFDPDHDYRDDSGGNGKGKNN